MANRIPIRALGSQDCKEHGKKCYPHTCKCNAGGVVIDCSYCDKNSDANCAGTDREKCNSGYHCNPDRCSCETGSYGNCGGCNTCDKDVWVCKACDWQCLSDCTECHGTKHMSSTCVPCFQVRDGCSCDRDCGCDGCNACNTCNSCYGQATGCIAGCDRGCYGQATSCTCNKQCYTEARPCSCNGLRYQFTPCATCDGCNQFMACTTCDVACDGDSCSQCHHSEYSQPW